MKRPRAGSRLLATATAVAVVAAGSAVYLVTRGDRSSTAPERAQVATIALGPRLYGVLAIGHGSVWIPTGDTITRLDSRSGDVIARIDMFGLDAVELAIGAESVWAVDAGIARPALLDRIDPTTNEVVARLELDLFATAMTVVNDDVWVASLDTPPGIVQIDGETNAVVDSLENFGGVVAAAGSDTGLWLAVGDGLHKIDPVTKRTVHEVSLPGLIDLSISGQTVWAVTKNGSIFRIDDGSGEIERTTRVGRKHDLIAASQEDVWVAESQPVAGSPDNPAAARVLQLSADSGKIVSRRSLRGEILALVADESGAWVSRDSDVVRLSRDGV